MVYLSDVIVIMKRNWKRERFGIEVLTHPSTSQEAKNGVRFLYSGFDI